MVMVSEGRGRRFGRRAHPARLAVVAVLVGGALLLAAPAGAEPLPGPHPVAIEAVGAENEYANVLSQIGGRYVHVSSILDNPNTDPHTFEASPAVAEQVARAGLIVQNGVGYDSFMNKIESATPNSRRRIIVAQHVLGLPDDTPNPHLWYSPTTMPAVAAAMAADLALLDPGARPYFAARLHAFDASLRPWLHAVATFRARYAGTGVATTEPVADYLLTAMGLRNRTPFVFQADIMNGVDPAPEDLTIESNLFARHLVKVFCYNQQVVDPLTTSIRDMARAAGVPVVGVYETMPTPGYDYQTWMMAEVAAIEAAVAHRTSTARL
jgi:zinc/manganese transport system substrate-binding protein